MRGMSIENGIGVDPDRAKRVIQTALNARRDGTGFFGENPQLPESRFVELVKAKGKKLGDPRLALHAIFLTSACVFGDDTGRLFQKITDPDLIDWRWWLFEPSQVVDADDGGMDVETEVKNFFQFGGYNAAAARSWVENCRVIKDRYGGDLRNFFGKYNDDAPEIVQALMTRPRCKTGEKREFYRFGPKLARLAIQWIAQYGLYEFHRAEEFGLPTDFQVVRFLMHTKILTLPKALHVDLVARRTVLPLIEQLAEANGWTPREISEALWLIGYYGCNRRRHNDCPIRNDCTSLISRKPYDEKGLFDPRDVGRFGGE